MQRKNKTGVLAHLGFLETTRPTNSRSTLRRLRQEAQMVLMKIREVASGDSSMFSSPGPLCHNIADVFVRDESDEQSLRAIRIPEPPLVVRVCNCFVPCFKHGTASVKVRHQCVFPLPRVFHKTLLQHSTNHKTITRHVQEGPGPHLAGRSGIW